MAKKNKLESLSQTHGKVETYQPTSLDQILGDKGLSKYGTMDEEEYIKRLGEMSKADLQNHAVAVGLMPLDERERLVKGLIREFRLFVSQYKHPVNQAKAKTPISPEVAKILAEGR